MLASSVHLSMIIRLLAFKLLAFSAMKFGAFTYAKAKNVASAKAAPDNAGDTWTWTGIDADSKLIVSWLVGGRDGEYAMAFMDDLRSRLANRVQLTTDGHKAYLQAVEGAFGDDVDYAILAQGLWQHTRERQGQVQPCRMHWHSKTSHHW